MTAHGTGSGPRHVWDQLHRYAGAVRWLAVKLWGAFRWRLVRAVVAAQLGVIIVGAGVALSVHYAQQLEGGGRLQLGGVALPARDETTLALVVAAVLAVLLAGGATLFWAQRRIVSMASQLNHQVRRDVALAYGGELPEAADWGDERSMWRALWILQTRDARRCAIVTRNLMRNTVHVGIAVVGVGALFALEPAMTVLLLAVMLVGLVAYYYANTVSVRATRRYEAIAPATRKQLHRLLPRLQTLSQPEPRREGFDAALGPEEVTEETDAFRDRFGAHIYAQLLNFAIMGVVLAGLIAYMGREALLGNVPWTRLVAYMVVLRITLSSIHSLFNTFAFFSRFYPSIDRLRRFFAASNSTRSSEALDELPLDGGHGVLAESDAMRRPVARGETVGVVLPVALSRYSLGLLARSFAGDDVRRRRGLLGQIAMAAPLSAPPVAASMQDLLPFDGGWDAETLRARLGDQAGPVEEAIGLDPRVAAPPEAWAQLPAEAAARLVLIAAADSERPVLAIDGSLAAQEGAERLEEAASDKMVLVCSNGAGASHDGLGITRRVVASQQGEALAVGSPQWIAENWDGIVERRGDLVAADPWDDEDLDEE